MQRSNTGHPRRPDVGANKRLDPRFPLPVKATVTLPGLPPREYGVCEISRSGMFLAFLNTRLTRPEFDTSEAGPGTELHVAFDLVSAEGGRRFEFPASIVRVTQSGVGVRIDEIHQAEAEALLARLPLVRTGVASDSA